MPLLIISYPFYYYSVTFLKVLLPVPVILTPLTKFCLLCNKLTPNISLISYDVPIEQLFELWKVIMGLAWGLKEESEIGNLMFLL